MAGSTADVKVTVTDTTTTAVYTMPRDGIFKASFTLNSGSARLTLQTRVSDGDWAPAISKDGVAISKAMATSAEHFPVELLALAGEQFRFVPSDVTSPDIDGLYGRCGGV